MKRLVFLLSLLVLPLLASAQQGDTLLLPDGRMFTIGYERAREHPDVTTDSQVYLVLTTRQGEEVTREIVPATREKGAHFNPAIAYDTQSGTLFAFWIHNSSMLLSQLMFASRDASGVWSEAQSFGAWADRRDNLRIAVTRKFEDEHGNVKSGLTVHLAWWQFNSETNTNSARYSMVTIDNGAIVGMSDLDLTAFVPKNLDSIAPDEVSAAVSHPLLFTSPKQDSVLLVFGDMNSGTLHTVRITPKVAGNGRLRVPGGKRESGGGRAPALDVAVNSKVEGVYGDHDRLALYTLSEGTVHYSLLEDGEWSEQRSIVVDEQLFSKAAVVDALRRLVSEQ